MTAKFAVPKSTRHTGPKAGIFPKGYWIINHLLLLWFCCGELVAVHRVALWLKQLLQMSEYTPHVIPEFAQQISGTPYLDIVEFKFPLLKGCIR